MPSSSRSSSDSGSDSDSKGEWTCNEGETTDEDEVTEAERKLERRRRHRQRLTDSIGQLLDDYSMISFCPLNIRDEDSIDTLLAVVDASIQYGEDLEVRDYDNDGGDE